MNYPLLESLGVQITPANERSLAGVSDTELKKLPRRVQYRLQEHGHTVGMNGFYPWDVEAALERYFG